MSKGSGKMALDGLILEKIIKQLQTLVDGKVSKITQISKTDFTFIVRKNNYNYQLLINAHSNYNRIQITNNRNESIDKPSNFLMLLRKHVENGVITSIQQFELDRCLTISINNKNDIKDDITRYIHVELMGKYANIILTDESQRILDALIRIPPFLNQERIIQPGATYQLPLSRNKINPFTVNDFDQEIDLVKQFDGLSPLLSKEIYHRLKSQSFKEIIDEIKQSTNLYIHDLGSKYEYHIIPLLHLSGDYLSKELMDGLDYVYHTLEEKEIIKQETGDLAKFIKKEIKKNSNKINKLQDSLLNAQDSDSVKDAGDYLLTNPNLVIDTNTLTFTDYSDNEITINVDPQLGPIQNANKLFKQYRKLKNSIHHLNTQISLATSELQYFQDLNQQLTIASVKDAREIKEELIKYNYLKAPSKKSKPKSSSKLNYLRIKYNDQITIYIGKNNMQNDYLTFKFAKQNHYWFHAQNYHGAHLVVDTDQLDEKLIRVCAMLSAYFSQAKDSSSIPVDYTQVRNIKKIPNTKLGYVSIKNHQTIYIDIDSTVLSSYLN